MNEIDLSLSCIKNKVMVTFNIETTKNSLTILEKEP